jgi:hypothetical protein
VLDRHLAEGPVCQGGDGQGQGEQQEEAGRFYAIAYSIDKLSAPPCPIAVSITVMRTYPFAHSIEIR